MSILSNIVNFILPQRCLKCGKIIAESDRLCQSCLEEINFITAPYCKKCGHPIFDDAEETMLCPSCLSNKNRAFRLSRSAFVYDDASKNLILGLKFMDKTENSRFLAESLSFFGQDILKAGVDILVPVPLHSRRLRKRHYNQSAILAKELGKIWGMEVDYTSLIRHINTRPQVEFSGRQRLNNVKGAFSVKNPQNIKGKRVVLIDDVLTTGSTLKQSTLALKKAGAKSVDTLTVARVC